MNPYDFILWLKFFCKPGDSKMKRIAINIGNFLVCYIKDMGTFDIEIVKVLNFVKNVRETFLLYLLSQTCYRTCHALWKNKMKLKIKTLVILQWYIHIRETMLLIVLDIFPQKIAPTKTPLLNSRFWIHDT